MSDGRKQPVVAVLGTGTMGGPMARNVARAGLEVRAWNRSRRKAEPLTADGVTVTSTPAAAIDGADLVVTMLADGDAVESVMDDTALDVVADDAVWIQTSTVGLVATQRLADFAGERAIAFVDAPVLGTRQPAEDGALLVLGSGLPSLQERCAPVFDAIGRKTLWLGEVGAGTRMKLVCNGWLLSLTSALGESMALSHALGVPPEQFLEILDDAPFGSPYAQTKGKAIIARDFTPHFSVKLAAKDARLVVDAAEAAGMDPELGRTVMNLYDRIAALGYGEEDMAAVVKASAR